MDMVADNGNVPKLVNERNKKDTLVNVIIAFCSDNGLTWQEPDEYGKPFVTDLCNLLWYIDGHHDVFSSRSCSIPTLFSKFVGFNIPERSKHRKRSPTNMSREKLLEYASVLQKYVLSSWMQQAAWVGF